MTNNQLTDEQRVLAYVERLKAAATVYLDVSAKDVPFYDKAVARRPFDLLLHPSDLLILIASYEAKEAELQERRKADSEPVAVVEPSDYVTAAQLVGEGPARKAVHELYEGALRIGDKLYRHAQPAPALDREPIGFRCRRNDGLGDWFHVYHRAPDEFERKHLVIENIYTAPQPAPVVPDEMLCKFYEVNSWHDLVRELVKHVEQLQDSAKRNVKPWEDTFPETLLPAYIDRVKQDDDACRAAMLNAKAEPVSDEFPPDEIECDICGHVSTDPEGRHHCCEDNSND